VVIEVLTVGQEEEAYNPKLWAEQELIEICREVEEVQVVDGVAMTKSRTIDYLKQLHDCFDNLPLDNQAINDNFVMKYGKCDNNVIKWKILSKAEQITECPMDKECISLDKVGTIKAKIPWDLDPCKTDYNSILINHFSHLSSERQKYWMCILKNPNLGNHWKLQVKKDSICFHREGDDDPDELVSVSTLCYHMCYSTI
jgi:hypothetical protein